MPSIGEVIQLARGGGADSSAAIDAVGVHRRSVAKSLLASSDNEQSLAARTAEIADLSASAFPWDPVAEDYEIAKVIGEQWASATPPPVHVVMAAMALGPAHHFPPGLRLALLPGWLRLHYARFLLGNPPIFLHPGEADRYAAHCIEAMAVLRVAIFDDRLPESPALAQIVSVANSVMIYFNEQQLKTYFRDKALIYEWFLVNGKLSLGYSIPLLKNKKKKIGILHRSLAPGTETYYLLAHLEERDRQAFEVTLYIVDTQPSALSDTFGRWVDDVVQLPKDIAGAVARIRQDRLDLCLITNNVAWGLTFETAVAAHRLAKVQVIGDASPATPGMSSSDIFLSSEANEPSPNAQDDYEEGLVRMPGPTWYFSFSHDHDAQTISCTRAALGVPDDHVLFFSGANYFKITPEVLRAWAEILARTPNSSLALMPFNANWQSDYPVTMFVRRLNRVLALYGIPFHRVRLLTRVPTRADLHAVMSLADVYLDSFPYPGACSLVDPLLVGLPVVVRRGRKLRTAQATSLLEMEGLENAICTQTAAYIDRAVRLARDQAYREVEAERVRRAAEPSLTCLRTEPLARKFTAFCASATSSSDARLDHLLNASDADLRDVVVDSLKLAFAAPSPAFRRLTSVEIVNQLLVPFLETLAGEGRAAGRVIDVGACEGKHAIPFLRAGFQVDMFEPDPDCLALLATVVQQFPERAMHHATAVIWEPAPAVIFNKRSPGLSGLGESPAGSGVQITVPATTFGRFLDERPGGADVVMIGAEGSDFDILKSVDLAAVAPKVITVGYGAGFPDQPIATIRSVIRLMDEQGYGAVLFEYKNLTGFSGAAWDYELIDVALDAERLGSRGDAFGTILFYRRAETGFLACLAQLIETFGPAQTRPAFLAMPRPAREIRRRREVHAHT
jgi:FkbM family methyltransferase